MEWILKICGNGTEALQGKSETLQTSLDLIASMGTLLARTAPPQADGVWDALWERANGLANDLELPELHERRMRWARPDYGEVQDKRCHSKEDYRTKVFIPTCEKVTMELDASTIICRTIQLNINPIFSCRFLSKENMTIYQGICGISPGSADFLNSEKVRYKTHRSGTLTLFLIWFYVSGSWILKALQAHRVSQLTDPQDRARNDVAYLGQGR